MSIELARAPAEEPRPEPPRRRFPLRWLVFGALAAGVAALFLLGPGEEKEEATRGDRGARPTPVSTAPVEVGPLTERSTYPGELSADAAEVAALVGGRLLSVSVRIGDQVEKGQELARVDTRDLQRQRAEAAAAERAARAAARRAGVELEAARREVTRGEKLLADQLISRQELDVLRSELESFEATVESSAAQAEQARARVAVLDQQMSESRIRAPFAGVVVARYRDPGSFVQPGAGAFAQPGTGVVRLVAKEPLRVRFEVPEAESGRLAAGSTFKVRAPPTGAAEFTGKVTGVASEVERTRRAVVIEGILEEPPPSWLPGMFAEVSAGSHTLESATIVPRRAIVSRLAGGEVEVGVFRLAAESAVWVPIEVVARDGDRVAIEGALEESAQVLVGGHTDLTDGAPVAPAGDPR